MGSIKSVLGFFRSEEEKRPVQNPGRNDLCWCGSRKKYKHCHLYEDEKKLKHYAANCVNG